MSGNATEAAKAVGGVSAKGVGGTPGGEGCRRGGEGRLVGVLFCLVLAAFVLSGLDKLHEGDELVPLDTAAYLRNARWVHEHGGALWVIPMCFTGQYAVADQMPLYVAILSVLRPNGPAVISWAKVLTFVLGGVSLVVIFLVSRRVLGPWVALLGAALLAMNSAYLGHGTVVACEVVLAMWMTLAWLFMVRYLRTGRGAGWMGLFVGLAYMTKVSGLFMAPVIVGALIWREGRRVYRSGRAWLCVGVLVLVSFPLLVRDVVRYRAVSWYARHSGGMWMDSPRDLERATRVRRTFVGYWRSHGVWDVARRVGRGTVQEGIFAVVACGESYLVHERLRGLLRRWVDLKVWPVGLVVVILAGATVFVRRLRVAGWSGWAVFAASAGFFVWFPFKDIRFVVPRVPMLLLMAAAGAMYGLEGLSRWRRLKWPLGVERVAAGVVVVLMSANVVMAATRPNVRKNPLRCARFPPGYDELLGWIRGHVEADTVWMMGPTHNYSYFWTTEKFGKRMRIPWVGSFSELQAYAEAEGVRYVVVDASAFAQREHLFREFMEAEGVWLRLIETPPGWRMVHGGEDGRAGVFVFEVEGRCGPDYPVNFRISKVALCPPKPKELLRTVVTSAWRGSLGT